MPLSKEDREKKLAAKSALEKEIADADEEEKKAADLLKGKDEKEKEQDAKSKEHKEKAEKKGEVAALSEDTAHALLEELRSLNKARGNKTKDKKGWLDW